MLKVFGIRHHGPGSARSMLTALQAYVPDCILIEMPQDTENALKYVGYKDLIPPVALLIYNAKAIQQASYYPFASFSPEWQALQYGEQHQIPVWPIDLPMSMQFSLDILEQENQQLRLEVNEPAPEETLRMRLDPLSFMAQIAGYSDSERWWEATFEQREQESEIFEAILEMITALRTELKQEEKPRTLLREAFMRKMIRKAVKDGFQKIAVVCGAWHAPVLQNFLHFKQSNDNALLKGIKKIKVVATWIPWSYPRLARQSGYGAGIISPAWYELLFHQPGEVVIRWMIKVAELFRKEDLDASAAHVMEAVRLAETLATLRQNSIPGMEELQEAALTVFGQGEKVVLDLIRNTLVVGQKVGEVPPEIPAVPLQKDLEKCITSAKLKKYWGKTETLWLKATSQKERGGIDLREPSDLLKSHLLHRLNILGINWGRQQETSQNDLSSFKEIWKMQWEPEFSIQIIEAGMWGNTVADAATQFTLDKASKVEKLPEMTRLIQAALQASLSTLIDPLIQKLQELAALTKDVQYLMKSLPDLVQIILYGDTRQTDTTAVERLVEELVPRICIGLPSACFSINEEMAEELIKQITRANHAINLLNEASYFKSWWGALRQITQTAQAHELIRGASTRILFDKGVIDVSETSNQFSLALSVANEPLQVAYWVEGFLQGSGLLLIHHAPLWQILDDWVSHLGEEDFQSVLPLLRRTFSNFTAIERQKMLERATKPFEELIQEDQPLDYDPERAATVLPVTKLILR